MSVVARIAVYSLSILLSLTAFGDLEAKPPGFSIRLGLLHDTPTKKIFTNMEAGVGYIGTIGFDFHERIGLEAGVLHSTHGYDLAIEAGAIREEQAERNAIMIKARGTALRIGRTDVILAVGPAHFDITGIRRFVNGSNYIDLEENFSGWGLTMNLDLRYHVTEGLAVTLYFSGNFVRYGKYSLNSRDTAYQDEMPRGDSFAWGLTLFHRIGMPKIN